MGVVVMFNLHVVEHEFIIIIILITITNITIMIYEQTRRST